VEDALGADDVVQRLEEIGGAAWRYGCSSHRFSLWREP
jgi:hypothetical protein